MLDKRILLLCGLLAVSYATIAWIGSGSDAAAAPAVELTTIPLKIADWVGEDVEINDDTIRVLNAQSFINRIYRQPTGEEVSLHVANWTNPDTISPAPHHPEICYPGAGWSLVERRKAEFTTATGNVPIELILFQKQQQRVVSGHWFRTGEATYFDYSGFQSQRRRFWGTQSWPDTTKYLMQVAAPSLDAAEETLKSFAAKVEDASHSQDLGTGE